MYKVNLFLKVIIAILLIISVIITNNYYVLFIMLLTSAFIYSIQRKILLFAIGFLLLIYLIFTTESYYLVIKLYLLFSTIYLFNLFLSIRQKTYFVGKYYKYSNIKRRDAFYEKNYNNILSNIKNNVDMTYDNEVSIDNKVRRDLERSYLQSRIRFFGFRNINNYHYESRWKKLDYMILLFSIILFIIIVIV